MPSAVNVALYRQSSAWRKMQQQAMDARYRCFLVKPFHDFPPYTVAHKRGPARHVAAVALY
jgi:hypothetical protein